MAESAQQITPLVPASDPSQKGFAPFWNLYRRISNAVSSGLPSDRNPFAQSGGVANICFLIATVSGIVLMIWYRPSVVQAYPSVTTISQSPWLAGWIRSLHRYSSDACLFFTLWHAAGYLFQRRFSGPRWLAWTSGVLVMTLIWSVGWTGYWLIWDERGQLVATSTAKVLDLLPIFADPLSRSFLTDQSINSLFFFVIFFFHMLVPLAIGIVIWIHITRISRPRFLTEKPLTLAILIALFLMSILLPADLAQKAQMLIHPQSVHMDAWYMLPVWLIDRLSAGAFWAAFLIFGLVLYGLPWFQRKGRKKPAEVEVSRCNACTKCYQDCPYGAISMVPRTDGANYPAQAQVDWSKCVSCGICAGSCDSAGIGLPEFNVLEVRPALEQSAQAHSHTAFICQEHPLANRLQAGQIQLDGYVLQSVPCLGWIHPLTIERLIKRGTQGVLLVGCGPELCRHREGWTWTEQRMAAQRQPFLRFEKVDPQKVRMIQAQSASKLIRQARGFLRGETAGKSAKRWLSSVAVLTLSAAIIWLGSQVPLHFPSRAPQLIVSFKHGGEARTQSQSLSPEELAKLPVHMRPTQQTVRSRAPVALKIKIDGNWVFEKAFPPGGVMKDSASIGYAQISLEEGLHQVEIFMNDTWAEDGWQHQTSQTIQAHSHANTVVLFDNLRGFIWYPQDQNAGDSP
ncbi:MAG: hydrogenase iron-sulfur subunit [Acidobacteria bacterium]|nr:hydrogenase iron-sulfur subunit [Acidobacteriota bacterium]